MQRQGGGFVSIGKISQRRSGPSAGLPSRPFLQGHCLRGFDGNMLTVTATESYEESSERSESSLRRLLNRGVTPTPPWPRTDGCRGPFMS